MKTLIKVVLVLIAALAIAGVSNYQRINRVLKVMNLFEADVIVQNFRAADSIFGKKTMHRAGPLWELPIDKQEIPATYIYQGKEKSLEEYLKKTWTTGFLIIKNGKIIHEQYFLGNDENTRTISWSVAKSFVSAVFGIAVQEGHIKSINDPVTQYVPYLKGSGYENVRIKDVLQMSSGVRFNEDYGDFHSDINKMGRALAFNTSIDEFVKSLTNERKPGTLNHYVSMDTQVLGMVIREATGKDFSSYMEEKLWKKLGAQADAYWLVDNQGMELVFGGLNAVPRDYGRFGMLYLNNGSFNGIQVVPRQWIKDSVTPDAPYLMPGRKEKGQDYTYGYGYQWWIPENPQDDFMAIGIYNQYIWISPRHNMVIVKTSAYPDYNKDGEKMTIEAISLFRYIAGKL